MTGYRIERIRARLVATAVLMVAAYCLHWTALLRITANAIESVRLLLLSNYEFSNAEAVMIGYSGKATATWMGIVGDFAALYAVVFAASALLAWRFLPRRATSALAAAGMFATYAFALPFLPPSAAIENVTGEPLSYYMGKKTRIEGAEAGLPLEGSIPWIGTTASAATISDATTGKSIDQIADLEGETPMERYFGWMRLLSYLPDAMAFLIGIGFWSSLAGLVLISLKGAAKHRVPETTP